MNISVIMLSIHKSLFFIGGGELEVSSCGLQLPFSHCFPCLHNEAKFFSEGPDLARWLSRLMGSFYPAKASIFYENICPDNIFTALIQL